MRPVVLVILDGWGVAPPGPGNAIDLAHTPFFRRLLNNFPHGLLEASGESVGLPSGEAGNTETGHLNLGAGFIVYQDLPRINLAIADGSFFQNSAFLSAISHARKYESNLHLLGLIGSGGVHSNTEHLLALLELFKEQDFQRVFLHLITDGRDSPPKTALSYIKQIESFLKNFGFGQIATIMGRYYAMDRDRRWERTRKAYEALTCGIGEKASSAQQAISLFYDKGITDEFIKPTVIEKEGKPVSLIKENDSVIFFNYRIDRPRQLTKAFVLDDFEGQANKIDFDPYLIKYYKKHILEIPQFEPPFQRGPKISHLYFVTMTEYSRDVHVSSVAFPPVVVAHPLGEVISQAGLRQLRASESEKERFVTYYFNGQRESPFINEDRLIVASPKVPTYDLRPEMSVEKLIDAVLKRIKSKSYDFVLINIANPDMVAHTGNLEATKIACESVDRALEKLTKEILRLNGSLFITGDHGNAEELINPKTGGVDTEHSIYPVPIIFVSKKWERKPLIVPKGILADVAPTILGYLHLKKPKEMTGRNLLENILK